MQGENKFNPPREFSRSLIAWAYLTSGISKNDGELKANEYENQIYRSSNNLKDYWNKLFKLIMYKISLDNQGNLSDYLRSNVELLVEKVVTYFSPQNPHPSRDKFIAAAAKNTEHKAFDFSNDNNLFNNKIYISCILEALNTVTDMAGKESPKTLKEIVSHYIINNSLVFGKLQGLGPNELPIDLKQQVNDLKIEVESGLYKR